MSSDTASPSRWPLAALLLANVVLACGPWLVRLAGAESQVGPIGSAFWRLALALPVLVVAAGASRDPLPAGRGALAAAMGVAGLLFAADLAFWHLGILRTRLANATLLGNVTAVLFPVYGFLTARRMPSARQALALAVAAGGAVLLVGRSARLSVGTLRGDLLCIAAGLCYTGYLVAVERVRRRLGPVPTLAGAVAAGAPILLAAALLLGDPIRPHAWAPLLALAAGSQLVGQGLILYAVARLEPLAVGLMLLVQPVVAAVIGLVVYREQLGLPDLAGAGGIALGVLLVRAPSPPRLRADGIGLSG